MRQISLDFLMLRVSICSPCSLLVVLLACSTSQPVPDDSQIVLSQLPPMPQDADSVDSQEPLLNASTIKAAFFINLDRQPQRRQHMETQLQKLGFDATRFPAVDVSQVASGMFDSEYLLRQGLDPGRFRQKDPLLINATVACFLSHVKVLALAREQLKKGEVALIMEDDVIIPDDWRQQFAAAMQGAPKDWDLIKVSGWGGARNQDAMNHLSARAWLRRLMAYYTRSQKVHWVPYYTYFAMRPPFLTESLLNQSTYYYAGTSAYLVRQEGIATVTDHLRNQSIKDVDEMLLSENLHFYEQWPHVIDLAADAFDDSSMHRDPKLGNKKTLGQIVADKLYKLLGWDQDSAAALNTSSSANSNTSLLKDANDSSAQLPSSVAPAEKPSSAALLEMPTTLQRVMRHQFEPRPPGDEDSENTAFVIDSTASFHSSLSKNTSH